MTINEDFTCVTVPNGVKEVTANGSHARISAGNGTTLQFKWWNGYREFVIGSDTAVHETIVENTHYSCDYQTGTVYKRPAYSA